MTLMNVTKDSNENETSFLGFFVFLFTLLDWREMFVDRE